MHKDRLDYFIEQLLTYLAMSWTLQRAIKGAQLDLKEADQERIEFEEAAENEVFKVT